jgi:hypothetical protein
MLVEGPVRRASWSGEPRLGAKANRNICSTKGVGGTIGRANQFAAGAEQTTGALCRAPASLFVHAGGSAAQRCEAFLEPFVPLTLLDRDNGPLHGDKHWFRPVQQTFMQRSPPAQSLVLSQSLVPVQISSEAQKQSPSVVWEQKHSPKVLLPQCASSLPQKVPWQGSAQVFVGEAANAGVRMLVSTGADHATAAPAPIRFSILRREIPPSSFSISESMSPPPSPRLLKG